MTTTPAEFWGIELVGKIVVDSDPRHDASVLLRARKI
jgi:hypothetical protein